MVEELIQKCRTEAQKAYAKDGDSREHMDNEFAIIGDYLYDAEMDFTFASIPLEAKSLLESVWLRFMLALETARENGVPKMDTDDKVIALLEGMLKEVS